MRNKKISVFPLVVKSGLLSALLVLAIGFFLAPKIEAKVTLGSEERELIEKLNEYRKEKKLKEFKVSESLSEAAKNMAEDMANNPGSINHEHKDSQGRLPSERASLFGYTDGVGENLAAGYSTVEKVFKAWKESVEHRNNIIDPDFKVIGVAFQKSKDNYKWYWVNMFGDKERKTDLLEEKDYSPYRKIKVIVTEANGNTLRKAKVTVWTQNRKKITSGTTNSKGEVTFSVEPKDLILVRAALSGYAPYTRKVKLSEEKGVVSVKIWLEKT